MEFKAIDFEAYSKIRNLLLISSEGSRETVYRDKGGGKGKATIGIGVNIEDSGRLWHFLVLCVVFGITKKANEIKMGCFDKIDKIKKIIIKDFEGKEAYKRREYEALIDNIHSRFGKERVMENGSPREKPIDTKKLSDNDLSKHLNRNIQDALQDYLRHTQTLQEEERQKRLSLEDLRMSKTAKGEDIYPAFRLNQAQAQELFSIMAINYEAMTLSALHKKNIHIFDLMKNDGEERVYYREFISLLSAIYQTPSIIGHNLLIETAFNYKSRFLLWACVRYTLGNDVKRRILQSLVFNFNNTLEGQAQSEQEAFDTCIDVFKTLNLKPKHTEEHQSYLEDFIQRDATMQDVISKEMRYCKSLKNAKACEIYRSEHVNTDELKPLGQILEPYVAYLNELIPKAKFEDNADFQSFSLEGKSQDSRFKPQNIYIVDNTNYREVAQALKAYKNASEQKENILICVIEKINSEVRFQKPSNTYLYLASVKGNYIDCAYLNNPLQECVKENDECELFVLRYDGQDAMPLVASLATQGLLELNDEGEAKMGHLSYVFKGSELCIQNEAELLRLRNYHFFLNPKPYVLITHLEPYRAYSTLGIQLQTIAAQDTFSNHGSYEIQLANINLQELEAKSKCAITQGSPLFAYVQESKTTHVAKLQNGQLSIFVDLGATPDSENKSILQNPKLVFLSFMPFANTAQANHTSSQKLQILSGDLEGGFKTLDFKVPLLSLLGTIGQTLSVWEEGIKSQNAREKYYIDDEGYLQGLDIIKAPRPKLTETTGNFQSKPVAIVLHGTDSHTAKSTLETWKTSPYGTHFLIDKDGVIYQCASLYKWTQHVGDIKVKDVELNDKNSSDYASYKNKTYKQVSKMEKAKSYPNRYPINSDSVGIEVVGKCFDTKYRKVKVGINYTQYNGNWEDATTQQQEATDKLVEFLKRLYNIGHNAVYGHGEISGHRTANEGIGLHEK